jgi:N-acetylmuramoyl-L-alanine amidase
MAKLTRIIPILVLLLMVFFTAEASALNTILNVRHWVAPDHTRIVIDTSEVPDYTIEKNKEYVRIDFKNTIYSKDLPEKSVLNKPGVTVISMIRLSEEMVRIEIFLADHVDTNVFKLSKIEEKPDRVVVDIELPEIEKKETTEREQVKTARKDWIVIIDPGHGGEDPGAIGRSGTQEKDIVLKIGRKLRDDLNKRGSYRAFLTRNGDYYVSFKKRLKIAREYGADLFLSIHADAARNRSAYGASVYCLSTSGASTEASRLLAMKENLADIVGGSPNGEISDASDPIVLNMYQTNTINTSRIYGYSILKNMTRLSPLKFDTVQGAPFRVLKLPEIPSLLVETGYISNAKEEKLLRSSRHQTGIANVLANAVVEILPVKPAAKPSPQIAPKAPKAAEAPSESRNVSEADVLQTEADVYVYKVKRGDTLAKIAQKQGTTLNALLKLNKMKLKDSLFTGRVIKIKDRPVEKEAKPSVKKGASTQAKKEIFTYYRVKKGETLEIIARRNGTTINQLRQLNRMKPSDPLLADQKLKLPSQSSP